MSDSTDMSELVAQRGKALRDSVRMWRRTLAAAEGSDDETLAAALEKALGEALAALGEWEKASRWLSQRDLDSEELKDLIRWRVKAWREESGRTQSELAGDMERLGFVTWKRITVAEVESGKRRLSFEELLGLTMLFGQTVDRMVAWTDGMVVLNERQSIDRFTLHALLGHDVVDAGEAAADSLGIAEPDDDWRPWANFDFGGPED